MNFDRNTIMGFLVLALLFIGYFWWTSKEQAKFKLEKARQDSIVNASKPKIDTASLKSQSAKNDSIAKIKTSGIYQKAISGTEQVRIINTNLLTITFSTKGGQPQKIELKKFNGQDSTPVKLASSDFDKIDYPINTLSGSSLYVSELNFNLDTVIRNADNSQVIGYS
ncbi:MAG TPA: hypothetical protein VK588_00170, partial [Chitinophagaceae bacterium]|nr:hypothetical protein [Chitinophagaceae bacterium]